MSAITLSTGQEYNPHLKQALVSSPGKAFSALKSGVRAAAFTGAGSVVGQMFGETAGNLVSSFAYSSKKDKKDKKKSFADYKNIIGAELKGLFEKSQEVGQEVGQEVDQEKEKKVKKEPKKGNAVIDVKTFMGEIVKASHEQLEELIKEKGITDEKVVAKLKEAEQAALEEIAKSLQAQAGADGLTVEHLKNIESNTNQLLKFFDQANSEEARFEANKPTAEKVAVKQLTEKTDSPLGGLFAALKNLGGVVGSLGSVMSGAIGTITGLLSKIPKGGLAVGALGALGIDALSDAYNSYKTGESNKYADLANKGAEKLGLVDKGESIGSSVYSMTDKVAGFFGLSDSQKEDKRIKETLKPTYEQFKAGGTVPEQLVGDLERLYGVKVPVQQIKKRGVVVESTNSASPQSEQAKEVVAGSAELSAAKTEKASQPIVIPVPTPQQASKAAEDVLNYVTTNGESTFRRLNDRLFSTAFV